MITHRNSVPKVLLVSSDPLLSEQFRQTLSSNKPRTALDNMERALFARAAQDRPAFGFECAPAAVDAVEKVRQAPANDPFAIVVIDECEGRNQLIRDLRNADENIRLVICSQSGERRWDVDSEVAVLAKPINPEELIDLTVAQAERWLVHRERTELEKIVNERTAELKHAALHDMLTGLPNRMLFNDRLETAVKRAKRDSAYRFAVLFVDCDRFKLVNDSLGHRAGDLLLLEIAERLKGAVRDVDTITPLEEPVAARLGGDEFAIVLDNLHGDADAARVAARLLNALSKPYLLEGREVHSSVSIGITTSSLAYKDAEVMIRDADTAMYRAKAMGGSRFVLFDEKMHEEAVIRLTLENDLRRAIERGQLRVHYQPIIAMRSRELMGFEALARWHHPQLGWIPPERFIPLAEETGAIMTIGVWILEAACEQLARWQKDNPALSSMSMSVNVSRRQLNSQTLVTDVQRILSDTGITPRNLKLEITESAIMDDPEAAVKVLKQIQQLGVQLHMDDFGSGFSSLSCLHSFPLDGLKIDREFVDGVPTRPNHAAVVRSVVSLAHNLRVPLVAEGIETQEQIAALEAMGCDQAQGYLFSKPMDAENATQFIAAQTAATNAA
ncbi:MAG TPA: EAL domain-containing protein [Tepidisphaeraceae bacterium]